MICIELSSLESTARLGRALARTLAGHGSPLPVPCVLLRGDLGSGKTTLTRELVHALPGGPESEVSSPSFTLCNAYPTTPPVLHFDLYRSGHALPDEVWEALDSPGTLTLIEWGEYVPRAALPEEYLDIRLETCDAQRLATVEPHGAKAREAVLALQHEDWILR